MKTAENKIVWTPDELRTVKKFSRPQKIQEFLNSIEYSAESRYRSPRSVLRDRKAHCFDGAVFAAAMLQRLGHQPIILDMQAVRDDDHLVALFKQNGRFGAVAKSNFTGLRFREPVYATLRELIMSYFEAFYNIDREKTLRWYSRPLNLSQYDEQNWLTNDAVMDDIGDNLNKRKTIMLLTPAMIRALHPVDDRTFKAGLMGSVKAGLYKPSNRK